MKEIKIKIPKELEGIVKENSVTVTGQGQVYEDLGSSNKNRYSIYRDINLRNTMPSIYVSKEYAKQRGIKDKDKILFVEYSDLNGRKMIDIFKAE